MKTKFSIPVNVCGQGFRQCMSEFFSDPEQWQVTERSEYEMTAERKPESLLAPNCFLPCLYLTKDQAKLNVTCQLKPVVTVLLRMIWGLLTAMQLGFIVSMICGAIRPSFPAFLPLLLGIFVYAFAWTGLNLTARAIRKELESQFADNPGS